MNQDNQPYLTDRTRSIAQQNCPRSRYWGWEYAGRGLSVQRSSIPLTVGLCVHRGLEVILTAAMKAQQKEIEMTPHWHEEFIDLSVEVALTQYDSDCRERGLEIHEGEDSGYVYFEQRALIEAMLRGWCVARLPSFLEEYEVVEVEREEELTLVEPYASDLGVSGGIIFMARADGLLRSRQSGDLYVLSFKTAAKYDERTARDNRYDMQGMSELAAIEARLEKTWKLNGMAFHTGNLIPGKDQEFKFTDAPPKIMGVQMEYLLKGERSKEYEAGSYSGPYRQNSPLIRPYMKQGILSTSDSFAWKFQYQDDYGANKRLGKGWSRVNIWEVMTIKEWIELLATGEVQPEAGDCLTAQFVSPPVIYRQEDEILSWRTQVTEQEKRVQSAGKIVSQAVGDNSYMLDVHFPQHRRACTWPSACNYIPLCHEGLGDNPLGTGLYQLRRAHHQREIEKFAVD